MSSDNCISNFNWQGQWILIDISNSNWHKPWILIKEEIVIIWIRIHIHIWCYYLWILIDTKHQNIIYAFSRLKWYHFKEGKIANTYCRIQRKAWSRIERRVGPLDYWWNQRSYTEWWEHEKFWRSLLSWVSIGDCYMVSLK